MEKLGFLKGVLAGNKLPIVLGTVALLLSLFGLFKSYNSSDLVYVDVNKLIQGYKRTAGAKAEFDKKAATMKANIDSLVAGWQNELKAYEKERASLSPKELKLKQELLGNKQQQINGYQEAIQKQIQEEDKKITQTVINEINDYVKEYGKKHGYKIIFGASGGGNIMYADESSDLTEDVLKGLNAEYEGKK
ncbi:OmpH family outer membrane protein [Flavobacterium sp. GCM10023249]|uniref:OmpH family outer membrane protein n=1 Tax=unclassified Flavobacterium TaxID=196869 RepID=UPI003606C208